MNINRPLTGLYYAGLLLVFAGILMQLTKISGAFPIFTMGLIPVLGVRIFNIIVAPQTARRINAILLISALFLTAAGAAIYFHRSYWILFIAIAAVLDGYASFRKVN